MNCSSFQKEYEGGSDLSAGGAAHLRNCDECQRFVREEEALTGLLSKLPGIQAPGDFQAGVRSRIASGRGTLSPVWGVARILLPSAAMLLIAGFVVMNSGLLDSPEEKIEPVAEVKDNISIPDKDLVTEIGQERLPSIKSNSKEPVPILESKAADYGKKVKQDPRTRQDERLRRVRKNDSGGVQSLDQASEAAVVTNPPGLNPERVIKPTQRVPEKPFTAKEILGALGVDAEWKAGKLVVKSVAASSIGDMSGIIAGDQIRSIDGRKVSAGTMSKGRVNGQIIKVRREGKEITINIRSN